MTCLIAWGAGSAPAQLPKTVFVGFANKSELNVIVVGYTVVNGSKRAGAPLQLKKNGGVAFEANVPAGLIRAYSIHDASNPARILGSAQVPIQGRDVNLDVVPTPGNPGRLMIVPAQ